MTGAVVVGDGDGDGGRRDDGAVGAAVALILVQPKRAEN